MSRTAAQQSQRISEAMRTAGIRSPSDLARRMELPRQTVHRWMSDGIDHISYRSLLLLADTLNVNARWLVFGEIGPLKPPIKQTWEADAAEIAGALDPDVREHWLCIGRALAEKGRRRVRTRRQAAVKELAADAKRRN